MLFRSSHHILTTLLTVWLASNSASCDFIIWKVFSKLGNYVINSDSFNATFEVAVLTDCRYYLGLLRSPSSISFILYS